MKLSRISGRERMACDEKEAADCIEKEERNREKKWREAKWLTRWRKDENNNIKK